MEQYICPKAINALTRSGSLSVASLCRRIIRLSNKVKRCRENEKVRREREGAGRERKSHREGIFFFGGGGRLGKEEIEMQREGQRHRHIKETGTKR